MPINVSKRTLGTIGEEFAVKLLQEKGLIILERNFRCRYGEIDIIAKDKGKVVFIEVKTRKNIRYGTPEESVDQRKQKKLRLLASSYLVRYFSIAFPCRFDVYSIYLNQDNELQSIQVFEDCF